LKKVQLEVFLTKNKLLAILGCPGLPVGPSSRVCLVWASSHPLKACAPQIFSSRQALFSAVLRFFPLQSTFVGFYVRGVWYVFSSQPSQKKILRIYKAFTLMAVIELSLSRTNSTNTVPPTPAKMAFTLSFITPPFRLQQLPGQQSL
jgi:hypothetical protein